MREREEETQWNTITTAVVLPSIVQPAFDVNGFCDTAVSFVLNRGCANVIHVLSDVALGVFFHYPSNSASVLPLLFASIDKITTALVTNTDKENDFCESAPMLTVLLFPPSHT